MANLKRLPKGYKARVVESKRLLNNFLSRLNNSDGVSVNDKINTIKKTVSTSQFYTSPEGDYHISFDYGIVSSEIILGGKNHKFRLFESCTVFIDDSEDFVDNYRW